MGSAWARLGFAIGGAVLGGWILGPALGMSVGFLAGSYLGSMIFPTDSESEMPPIHDYPVQSSAIGIPITIVYGTTRVAGNILWISDLVAYQIKHSSGGGKGGGGEQASYETRYRRSFLIAICEGPALILRAWKGKTEIEITEFTTYTGDGNSGISTLIGENYAEYSNLCLAYFEDYELGNSQTIPNFVFEVKSIAPGTIKEDTFYLTKQTTSPNQWLVERIKDNQDDTFTIEKSVSFSTDLAKHNSTTQSPFFTYVSRYDALPPRSLVIAKFDLDLVLQTDWQNNGYLSLTGDVVSTLEHIQADGSDYLAIAWGDDSAPIQLRKPDGSLHWSKQHPDSAVADGSAVRFASNGDVLAGWFVGNANWAFVHKLKRADGSILRSYGTDTYGADKVGDVGELSAGGDIIIIALYRGGWRILSWPETGGDLNDKNFLFNLWPVSAMTNSVICCHSNGKIYVGFSPCTSPHYSGTATLVCLDNTGTLLAKYNTGAEVCDIIQDGDNIIVIGNRGTNEDTKEVTYSVFDASLNYLRGWDAGETGPSTPYVYHSIAPYYRAASEPSDCNFATMIKDLLINERYGNYEESDLIAEDFESIIAYCEANSLKGSLKIMQQRPLPDWISYICSHFQGYFYEVGGKVGLNCYRSQDSVLSISQDDLIRDGDEPPVHTTKRAYSSTFNRLEATWTNRDNDYKTAAVPAFDRIDQRESGQVRTKTMDLKAITNSKLASKMAWRIFIDQIYRFGQYIFKLGYKSMLLEVGNVIDVTDGHLLVAKKMRVMSISEEKDGRRALITAVEDISDLYPIIEYSIQESEAAVDPEIVLTDGTITFRESWNSNRLYLSITPGGTQCNGFYVYRSYDDASYDLVAKAAIGGTTGGEVNSTGTILSNLPAYTTVIHRSKETFNVSIGTVTDLDTSITDDDFFNYRKLAKIGDEIIAYKTCVESAVEGTWQISNLVRGLFGTKAVAHSPGETFSTLDIDFSYPLQLSDIGKTLYFKVISYYANEYQLVSEVSSQNYTVSGKYVKPLPVSLARINGREGLTTYKTNDVTIDWYFCSKISGFGRGGYGNSIWGAYSKDPLLERLKVELEEVDGTPITDSSFELDAYGGPAQLEILEADRNGKNPIVVKLSPMSWLVGDSREITIEKI